MKRKTNAQDYTSTGYDTSIENALPQVFLDLITSARESKNLNGLTVKQTAAKVAGSRAGVWAAVKLGVFPPPIKVSARSVAWIESEVNAVLAAKRQMSRAKQTIDLKTFVTLLTAPGESAGCRRRG